jgi:hypothetical protein
MAWRDPSLDPDERVCVGDFVEVSVVEGGPRAGDGL